MLPHYRAAFLSRLAPPSSSASSGSSSAPRQYHAVLLAELDRCSALLTDHHSRILTKFVGTLVPSCVSA